MTIMMHQATASVSPLYIGLDNNPITKIDPDGRAAKPIDDHYNNNDSSIRSVKTDDPFDRSYIQNNTNETGYRLAGQLDRTMPDLCNFLQQELVLQDMGLLMLAELQLLHQRQ